MLCGGHHLLHLSCPLVSHLVRGVSASPLCRGETEAGTEQAGDLTLGMFELRNPAGFHSPKDRP